MPRLSRWSANLSRFDRGKVSAAAAEEANDPQREAGLLEACNVELLRSGGVRTRAPLERVAGAPALPRVVRGAIRQLEVILPPGSLASTPEGRAVDEAYLGDAVARLDPETGMVRAPMVLPSVGRLPTGGPFLVVSFEPGSEPRAVCFHGVRLLRGSAVTTAGQLSFEVGTVGDPTRISNRDTDPFVPQAFAPGVLTRDVLVQLTQQGQLGLTEVRLRQSAGAPALQLAIEGVSAFSYGAGAGPVVSPRLRQHRLVRWEVGGVRLMLVFGLGSVDTYAWPEGTSGDALVHLGGSETIWSATARQLREMQPMVLRKSLVLCHTDWPRPRECRFDAAGALSIGPLAMSNVPDLPEDTALVVEAELRVGEGTLQIRRSAGDVPNPAGLRLAPASDANSAIDLTWRPAAGAVEYDVVWGLASGFTADPRGWLSDRAGSVRSGSLPLFNQPRVPRTEYRVTGLVSGSEYVFAVRALYRDAGGSELASSIGIENVVRATAYDLPEQVSGVVIERGDARTERVITWNAAANARSYEVQVRAAGATEWRELASTALLRAVTSVTDGSQTYEARVRVRLPNGLVGAWSAVASVAGVQPLAAPTGLSVGPNDVTSLQIDVSWTNPAGVNRIELAYRTGTTGTGTLVSLGAVESYVFASGSTSFRYQFRVRAVDDEGFPGGWTGWSVRVRPTVVEPEEPTLLTAPDAAPQGVQISDVTSAEFRIGWEQVERTAEYVVEWRVGTTGLFRAVHQGLSRSVVISVGVQPSTTYNLRVRAINAAGDGPASSIVSVTTLAPVQLKPPHPTNGRLTAGSTPGSLTISWDSVPGATWYQWVWREQGGLWNGPNGTAVTTVTFPNPLTPGATYEAQVRAQVGGILSDYSPTFSGVAGAARAAAGAPGVPTGVSAAESADPGGFIGQIRLSWSRAARAVHYEFRWRVTGARIWSEWINAGSGTSLFLRGGASTTYEFQVRAVAAGAAGSSDASETASVTTGSGVVTPPPPALATPRNLRAATSDARPELVVLRWDGVTGSTNYEYRWRVAGGRFSSPIEVGQFGPGRVRLTSTVFSGRTNTTYEFQVRATAGSATAGFERSAWTQTVSVLTPLPCCRYRVTSGRRTHSLAMRRSGLPGTHRR